MVLKTFNKSLKVFIQTERQTIKDLLLTLLPEEHLDEDQTEQFMSLYKLNQLFKILVIIRKLDSNTMVHMDLRIKNFFMANPFQLIVEDLGSVELK